MMAAATTTPELEDYLKFEDCRNCGKGIQYVMGYAVIVGLKDQQLTISLLIYETRPLNS
jgi:hypothetical protein